MIFCRSPISRSGAEIVKEKICAPTRPRSPTQPRIVTPIPSRGSARDLRESVEVILEVDKLISFLYNMLERKERSGKEDQVEDDHQLDPGTRFTHRIPHEDRCSRRDSSDQDRDHHREEEEGEQDFPGPYPTRHRSIERSEEHTSELQSRGHLVCRLLLEKKKKEHK